MGAVEFVVGLGVVIEFPDAPAIGVVAGAAMDAERELVNIVTLVARIAIQRFHLVAGVQMAFFARYGGMQSDERKTRHVMIKNHAFVPFLLVMAARTFLAFLAFVYVIAFMAGKTGIAPLFLVQVAAMTILAGDVLVGALQGELGVLVMGESGMFPLAGGVTAVAFAAVAAGMLVVMLVTVVALGAQLYAIKFAGMTGFAANGDVGAGQFEFSILVVIEYNLLPFPLVMALPAFIAVASRVHVIYAMAGHAFRGQIFIAFIGMAAVAGSFLVLAVQRKFGFVMIEATGLPSLDAMTLFAGLAEASLVRVILVMTVIACRRCITMFGILLMATGTGQSQMCAFQREIGLMMIKGIRIKMHDVGIASYMLGMAGLAR